MNRIRQAGQLLIRAEKEHRAMIPLTTTFQELTTDEAYQIQLQLIEGKVKHGAEVVGRKIGLTSQAMQQSLGVDEPDYGHLLADMRVPNQGVVSTKKLFQPRVEAEIAFVLKEDLKGPSLTGADVAKATDTIVPALEIIDSRIKDWRINLADTIADNASSGLFVLGDKQFRMDEVNLPKIEMALYKNGSLMNTGKGSAVLGDPKNCVAWLANKLAEFDVTLKAGEVVLSGALSEAVPIETGDQVMAQFIGLGDVEITFS